MELDEFYKLFISYGSRYSTDTRKLERGDIFFALKGDNFNGNTYAMQALKDGASYAVVDEKVGEDVRLIQVDNVLRFFQRVANLNRRAYSIPLIAIAGSNGKTTTKNLISAVLSTKYKTHVTKGNLNNHIGVPMTLLDTPQDAEIAVIELGTNSPGEIKELCNIVEPNYGLITNIGKEHLEGFRDLEAVANEESELYHYLLKNDGLAFVNADDDWLKRMSRSIARQHFYQKNDVNVHSLVPLISFEYKGRKVDTKLMGDYNLDNILTAIAIGEHFLVSADDIAKAISEYTPDNNRSQYLEFGSNKVWLDAYNANPSSMEKAIQNFKKIEGAKVLVLGDMFEMGSHAAVEHQALLDLCASLGFEQVYLLGEEFGKTSLKGGQTHFHSMEDLQKAILNKAHQNTHFLVKGSRGMKMERALEALKP